MRNVPLEEVISYVLFGERRLRDLKPTGRRVRSVFFEYVYNVSIFELGIK